MFHAISAVPYTSVSCNASGAGSGCTVGTTSGGTNNAGKFVVTMGTGGGGGATFATISFVGGVTSAPGACIIAPATGNTATLGAASQPFVYSVSTGGFVVNTASSAPGAGTYTWWYVCM